MFDFEFHFHKWTHDSQGAIYCIRCRKFRGWMPGEISIHKREDGATGERRRRRELPSRLTRCR